MPGMLSVCVTVYNPWSEISSPNSFHISAASVKLLPISFTSVSSKPLLSRSVASYPNPPFSFEAVK